MSGKASPIATIDKAHGGAISSMCVRSPMDKTMLCASGGADGSVGFWELGLHESQI